MTKSQVETTLLKQIKEVLSTFPMYWEKETLLRNKVIEDIRSYEKEVIEALLSNELIRDTYSIQLDSGIVFKTEDFISMLRYKNYWENSYTRYSNEIGLTSEGKYLNYNTDVVLDFPHKDGVLEGGMTKEDSGKSEIYYHNILAKEEIDTLFAPKTFSNIRRYRRGGAQKESHLKEDDNLIIKGNNLIALHTLKDRYTNKVKMIYIDPPYNTENDSFKYNDNFSHSTWLTFIKNRLVIARELLAEDGVIFINTDEIEQAYLKVLTDEVFGRDNFIGDIIWKKRRGGGNDSHYMALDHDYIAVFVKNKSKSIHNKKWRVPYESEYLKRYNQFDEDLNKRFYWDTLARDGLQSPIKVEIDCPDGTTLKFNSQKSKQTILNELESGLTRITKTRNGWSVQHRIYQPEGKVLRSIIDQDKALNSVGKGEIEKLFNSNLFSNPKPEKLLEMLINMVTQKGDIVLDFFMGSSTTQAVAHKMNRQYIGIEQMDYISEVSVPRLQKVIEGEQGGISKDVDWQGGGSFVYAELHSLNDRYVKDIQNSNTDKTLEEILKMMKESAYLNFKVDLERVTVNDEGYQSLTLEEKKAILIQVLDMNQLYLNYSEIDDTQYNISDDEKAFNHSFYNKEGDE